VKRVQVKLTPEDKDFKKTKVVHWIPRDETKTTKVKLVEFDHLISVRKMEEDTKIEDVVTATSRFETIALAEKAIESIKKGDFIQLERIGYYYVDKDLSESDIMVLHYIPDGKTKTSNVLAHKVDAKAMSKGADSQKVEDEKKKAKEAKNAKKEEKKVKKEKNKENKTKQDETTINEENKTETSSENKTEGENK
jgi:hypothetical protein